MLKSPTIAAPIDHLYHRSATTAVCLAAVANVKHGIYHVSDGCFDGYSSATFSHLARYQINNQLTNNRISGGPPSGVNLVRPGRSVTYEMHLKRLDGGFDLVDV